jgi:hypothetical protein
MIRKYLERNGEIRFEKGFIDGQKVIKMKYSAEFWYNDLNFFEYLLLGILDRCSGKYGYRRTMVCSPRQMKFYNLDNQD